MNSVTDQPWSSASWPGKMHRTSTGARTAVNVEPENIEQGLLKLVLSVLELVRQLLEKQAMRRIDAGDLNIEETERLGVALMCLEEKIKELQQQFDIDDLNLDLGPLGTLLDKTVA